MGLKAASVKPTLTQAEDLTKLGPPQELAVIILPENATLLRTDEKKVERPAVNTAAVCGDLCGKFLGTLEVPARVSYQSDFVTPDSELHVAAALSVVRRQLYLMYVTIPEDRWSAVKVSMNR